MQRLGQADGAPDTTQPPFPKHVTCQSFNSSLVDQASGQAINAPSQIAQSESFPLRPGDLRERLFSRKVNLSNEINDFRNRATRFVSGGDMPDRVEYPDCCGELCRNHNTRRSVLFHDRLLELLKTVVQSGCGRTKGWAKHVPAANICLAAECYVDRDPARPNVPAHPSRVTFYAVASASGRQAHHPAQINLVQLQPDTACATLLVCYYYYYYCICRQSDYSPLPPLPFRFE